MWPASLSFLLPGALVRLGICLHLNRSLIFIRHMSNESLIIVLYAIDNCILIRLIDVERRKQPYASAFGLQAPSFLYTCFVFPPRTAGGRRPGGNLNEFYLMNKSGSVGYKTSGAEIPFFCFHPSLYKRIYRTFAAKSKRCEKYI